MDNKELELKVKEIIAEENFFNMVTKAMEFEKEYKNSDFFKLTKLPMMEMLKSAKQFYTFNVNELFKQIQEKINTLDTSNLLGAIEGIGTIFEQENQDINSAIETLKELDSFKA